MQEAGKRVEEDEKTEVRVSAVMMPDNDMDHSKGSGNKVSPF